jgi:hypothetical protein
MISYRVADPGSPDPGSRVKNIRDPDPHQKLFLGNMIWDVHPASGAWFYPSRIPDPFKKARDPGSGSATLISHSCLAISVADPGCLSRIPDPNFSSGSRIQGQKDSRFDLDFKYFFTLKIVSKLSENLSRMFIPDPDPDFFPILDPLVKKAPDPDPGPGSATLLKITHYVWQVDTAALRACTGALHAGQRERHIQHVQPLQQD